MKPPLRTKSVGTKVSEAEFALLEERARGAGWRGSEGELMRVPEVLLLRPWFLKDPQLQALKERRSPEIRRFPDTEKF